MSVAGAFHPADPDRLREVVGDCFDHDLGPGRPGEPTGDRSLLGVVVPHAGYRFSGPVAARAYKALAEDGAPETAVVVGPDHARRGPAVATTDALSTPLGEVPIDGMFVDALGDAVDLDARVHEREHSVKVQLPFLQALVPETMVVPLLLADQDRDRVVDLGRRVAEAAGELDRDAVVVASTDFSHVGPRYGQRAPDGVGAGAFAERQDEQALAAVADLNLDRFYTRVFEEKVSMCGYGAVGVLLAFVAASGGGTATRLGYATTQDVEDADVAVGYAAVRVDRA